MTLHHRGLVGLAVLGVLTPLALASAPAQADPAPTQRWIVSYRPGTDLPAKARQAAGKGHRVHGRWSRAVTAMAVEATPQQARQLASDPQVTQVQPDRPVHATGTQANPGWALDRIGQGNAVDGWFSPRRTGKGVQVFVLDSGINASHVDFTGRLAAGVNTVDGSGMSDGFDHGTHVAGLAAGNRHGVAKKATIVPVKVLNQFGDGSSSSVVAGIDWVLAHRTPGRPAVVNMSLAGDSVDPVIEQAVQKLISSGITVVAAAGNSGADACGISPGRIPAVITVSAVDNGSPLLTRWTDANRGSCVDLFAPGVNVLSASNASATGEEPMTGTSMATPLVTGMAALVLQSRPRWTPAEVQRYIVTHAGTAKIADPGSPNRLLDTIGRATPGQIEVAPTPAVSGSPVVGQTLRATTGSWGSGSVRLSVQWLRESSSGRATVIPAATSTTYVVQPADRGNRLRVRVTGWKSHYVPTPRHSSSTAVVS